MVLSPAKIALACGRASRNSEHPCIRWRIVLADCQLMTVLGAREDQLEQPLGHRDLLLSRGQDGVLVYANIVKDVKVHPLALQFPES
eukprot:28006-Prymnesium_polylepis.1